MYIAIENGYFEDEGLDIEQVTVDAAHVSEAIGADQVDVGMGLIGKMLQPLENGSAHQVHHRPAHRLHQAARTRWQQHQEHCRPQGQEDRRTRSG